MRANYRLQRLYTDSALALNGQVQLVDQQAHYLTHVLRMKENADLLLFNGSDGEWRGKIIALKKKHVTIALIAQERPQPRAGDLIYCFAPLKHARLDYMVQKAVEMGASTLQPVMTRHTQVARLNEDRMRANIIEAAEQCGVLSIPDCAAMVDLPQLLQQWQSNRHLIFCDESAQTQNPLLILQKMQPAPLGVLIGPEGGFSEEERLLLKGYPFVTSIPLGPRILRADTAAVAALAVVNAVLGDWSDTSAP
ncbi:16S rRNA (uracil(1498)-N(3))-methyltransferase [Bartonella sp. LJL80]